MIAELIPHGSNAYDAAIVLGLALIGLAQVRLQRRANIAHDRADRAAIKAEATQQALPEGQRQEAKKIEDSTLVENGYTLRHDLRKRGNRADRR